MEKPLLISGPLIQPVQLGIKTITRRLNGLDWINELPDTWEFVSMKGRQATFQKFEGRLSMHVNCPYGEPGDTIWVRENWFCSRSYNDKKAAELLNLSVRYGYAADYLDKPRPEWSGRLRPSIHMPKWLCRIYLEVTSVRIERLHDITEADCLAEGIQKYEGGYKTNFRQPDSTSYLDGYSWTAKDEFKKLWIKLNGQESWDLQPWVWVVSFKLKNQTNGTGTERLP